MTPFKQFNTSSIPSIIKSTLKYNYGSTNTKILSDKEVSSNTLSQITSKVKEVLVALDLPTHYIITIILIKYSDELADYFDSEGIDFSLVSGGATVIKGTNKYIILNEDYLVSYKDDMINKTLPHEILHYITEEGHNSKEWQKGILELGLDPEDLINHFYIYSKPKDMKEL